MKLVALNTVEAIITVGMANMPTASHVLPAFGSRRAASNVASTTKTRLSENGTCTHGRKMDAPNSINSSAMSASATTNVSRRRCGLCGEAEAQTAVEQ